MIKTNFVTGTTITSDFLNNIQESDNIEFTPEGTGAVTRTVESKLMESVSVKDFGAVGDGVVDDTAAIQAAIDAAYAIASSQITLSYDNIRTGGIVVYLPTGRYNVTSTINLKDDVGLRGAGRLSSVIVSSYDGPILRNSTFYNYNLFGMSLSDFTIIGDATKTNQVGISILRDTEGTYSNILIHGCGSHGFLLRQCVSTTLQKIEVLRCGGNGLVLEDGTNSWADLTPNDYPTNACSISDCHFYGNDGAGIYLGLLGVNTSSNGNVFSNCVTEYNYYSSQAVTPTGYNVEIECESYTPNEFIDHWAEGGCKAHIYFNGGDGSTPVRFTRLRHFSAGAAGNVERAAIVVSGILYLDSPWGQAAPYKTVSGSNAPFRITKASSSIKINDAVGSEVTNNLFVEDETYATTNLYSNVRQDNYGYTYGAQNNVTTSGSIAQDWTKEGESYPFFWIVPGFGIGFGDGSAGYPDAYLKQTSANTIGLASGDFIDAGGQWDESHLKMGGYHLWIDGSGKLRIAFGAPASDTAGTVVGTQT